MMDADKPFTCDVCGKAFKKNSDLTKHTRVHTGVKPYKCDICEKAFTQSNDLVKHKRIHTGEKPYECDICEKTFIQSSHFADHNRIHTGEKPFQCNVCEKTFSRRGLLAGHKRIHTGEKPFECDFCKKTFSKNSNLADHKRIHTGEKPYSCKICQKSYSCSSNLSHHNKSAAHINRMGQINVFSSNYNNFIDCDEAIKVEDNMEEIKEEESVNDPLSIHQEIGNSYICEVIKDREEIKVERVEDYFSNQQERDGIRLYSCDICKEKFKERIVLMMHKDINHSQYIS